MTIPGHVIGHTATADDSDSCQINIDTPLSINIWAKGMGKSFSGWFELRYASDPDTKAPVYFSYEFPAGTVIPFERAGTWILTVRPGVGAGEGYELFLSEVDQMQSPQLQIRSTSKFNSMLVNVNAQDSFRGDLEIVYRHFAEEALSLN
ncbi:MAG: hypothetical protein ABJA18_13165 [bacterium]